jgi:hypothetical protein
MPRMICGDELYYNTVTNRCHDFLVLGYAVLEYLGRKFKN